MLTLYTESILYRFIPICVFGLKHSWFYFVNTSIWNYDIEQCLSLRSLHAWLTWSYFIKTSELLHSVYENENNKSFTKVLFCCRRNKPAGSMSSHSSMNMTTFFSENSDCMCLFFLCCCSSSDPAVLMFAGEKTELCMKSRVNPMPDARSPQQRTVGPSRKGTWTSSLERIECFFHFYALPRLIS